MKAGFKWVQYYFVNYGREAVGGLGPIPPSFRRGYWTQPPAMRVFAGNGGRGLAVIMDPRESGLTLAAGGTA